MIQRAYNASAVRVITEGAATSTSTETPAAATGDSTLDVSTSARGNGTAGNKVAGAIYGILNPGGSATGGAGGAGVGKDATMRVVPAVESREGTLCVEMRIRLYKDGAMSKLLEQLPNVRETWFVCSLIKRGMLKYRCGLKIREKHVRRGARFAEPGLDVYLRTYNT